jgi:dTDP-L-rhamnose 4-epimerase
MRVLVTGGSGFIGSHVVDALKAARHDVVVIDLRDPRTEAGSPETAGGVEYRRHSLCDADAVRDAVYGCDAVSHHAAKVGLGVDFGDVLDYTRHNDVGTATLLRALHDRAFRGRFVLASSMVVYGEGAYRCRRHGSVRAAPRSHHDLADGRFDPTCDACGAPLSPIPVTEAAVPDPRNVYAATKLHQEHLATAFAIEHPGVAVTALRYHNVYGPRMPDHTPYAGVASIFRSALARGEAPHVFEDGLQRRDFVHVLDVARANLLALTTSDPLIGPVNIATGEPHTVLEMADALADACGPGAPRPQVVGGARPGDVRHVTASPELATTRLGFSAGVDFTTGMRELATAELRR